MKPSTCLYCNFLKKLWYKFLPKSSWQALLLHDLPSLFPFLELPLFVCLLLLNHSSFYQGHFCFVVDILSTSFHKLSALVKLSSSFSEDLRDKYCVLTKVISCLIPKYRCCHTLNDFLVLAFKDVWSHHEM